MDNKRAISLVEYILTGTLLILVIYGLFLYLNSGNEVFLNYVREDGLIEYLTSIFLFLCSLVCLYRVFIYRRTKIHFRTVTWAVLAFLFFFAAGDEISWGQRIFGIESGEFFLAHNKQSETNIHNLVVNGKSVNVIIFSRLLFLILTVYFLFSRLIISKIGLFRDLQAKFIVPLPRTGHVVVMIGISLLIAVIRLAKGSELNELSFAIVFLMIFLNPVYIVDEAAEVKETSFVNA